MIGEVQHIHTDTRALSLRYILNHSKNTILNQHYKINIVFGKYYRIPLLAFIVYAVVSIGGERYSLCTEDSEWRFEYTIIQLWFMISEFRKFP